MDAADFKGLVSDQWHVGVVGTNDLAKTLSILLCMLTMPGSLPVKLTLCNVAEDWFRLFCPAATGASSEP